MDDPILQQAGVNPPKAISLSIKEHSALHAAYMPFLKGGGIFVPTKSEHPLGEEVLLLLTLMDDHRKFPVVGRVVWITPGGAHGNRPQGVGIQFRQDANGIAARNRIEELLAGVASSSQPTHTM